MRTIAALCVLSMFALLAVAQEGEDSRVQGLEKRVKALEKEVATLKKQMAELLLRDRVRQYVETRVVEIEEEVSAIQEIIDNAPEDADTSEFESQIETLWAEFEALDGVTQFDGLKPLLEERRDRLNARIRSLKDQRDKAETDEAAEALSTQIKAAEKGLAGVQELLDLGDLSSGRGPVLWQMEMASPVLCNPALGDLDGDGKPELVLGAKFNNETCLLCLNAADGAEKWRAPGLYTSTIVTLADLDLDGKLEVLAHDEARDSLVCLGHDGKEQWTLPARGGVERPCAVADLDGDRKVEIVVCGRGGEPDYEQWVRCYVAGTRELKWECVLPPGSALNPLLVDCNGDKVLDVVVTTRCGDGKGAVRAVDGKKGAQLWSFGLVQGDGSGGSIVGAALNTAQNRLYVHTTERYLLALSLDGKEVWRAETPWEAAGVLVADMNKDGEDELIYAGKRYRVFETLKHTEIMSVPNDERWWSDPALADADGDGDLDLVRVKEGALVAMDWRTGNETMRIELATSDAGVKVGTSFVVGDFDGDGLAEVFFAAQFGKDSKTATAFAVRLKGKALPGGDWTTSRGNNRRTGNLAHR